MSLGMAAGMATQGYLKQENVEERRDAGQAEAQASGEERKLRMDKFKSEMKRENFKDAATRMLVGDFSGAIESFNKSGNKKIAPDSIQAQKDDEGNTIFSWQDGNTGEDVVMDSRFMMLTAGIKPSDLETPEGKHKRAMELQSMKTAGGRGDPADVKLYNHIINNLKNPTTGEAYTPEEAWREARRSPESRLKIAQSLASGIQRGNPGIESAEVKEQVMEIMGWMESEFGHAGGAMSGPNGSATPAAAGGAADYMPTEDQIAGKAKNSAMALQREGDVEDPYDFD